MKIIRAAGAARAAGAVLAVAVLAVAMSFVGADKMGTHSCLKADWAVEAAT